MASEIVKRSQLYSMPCEEPKTAYERLGDFTAKEASIVQNEGHKSSAPESFKELCVARGVRPDQSGRIQSLWEITCSIHRERNLYALPVPSCPKSGSDNSGIFYLKNGEGMKVAVFKMGAFRNWCENVAMTLAHETGLAECFVDSVPAVLENPLGVEKEEPQSEELIQEERNVAEASEESSNQLSTNDQDSSSDSSDEDQSELYETTFGGHRKVYTARPKKLIGLVQPYLAEAEAPGEGLEHYSERSHLQYAKMVMGALVIGLRDGKESSFTKATKKIFDIGEEVFPRRLHPLLPRKPSDELLREVSHGKCEEIIQILSKQPASTDLPLLRYLVKVGDKKVFLADQEMTPDMVRSLSEIAKKWDLVKIRKALEEQKILFFDERSEKRAGRVDESGSSFKVETDLDGADLVNKIEAIRLKENRIDVIKRQYGFNVASLSPERRELRLKDEQIETTLARLSSLKQFFLRLETGERIGKVTVVEMVLAVDPYFGALIQALSDSPDRMSEQVCYIEPDGDLSPAPSPTRFALVAGRSTAHQIPSERLDPLLRRINSTPTPPLPLPAAYNLS